MKPATPTCFCLTLDSRALAQALDSKLAGAQISELVQERCPYVFAARPVFVDASQIQRMAEVIQAIESVVALPAYRDQVLDAAPSITRRGVAGPKGVFFGYDFHLGKERLGLIEINTNAGGAMLNAVLARAQHGLRTVIVAPTDLQWRHGVLWAGELAIDLVYNRLTDFYLEKSDSAALREAYLQLVASKLRNDVTFGTALHVNHSLHMEL